ncbi:MAG: TdeIII family type II restriction endonuclease [candidate division Zixibacteria bacterium]|nr:TdeIII family type II restriction endonuclease [candidate division Zixibacteria bacterium]
MSLPKDKEELIALEVIRVLFSRFEDFPEDALSNRNAPFHEAFIRAFENKFKDKVCDIPFFISMSSWLQGLNTTLGQTFFERVSHILCDGEKREYTSKKSGNLQIGKVQKDVINTLITDLSNTRVTPDFKREDELLFINDLSESVNAIDFSADIFIEDDKSVTAIELKSVRPNSGEIRGEKQKLLEGKAALFRKFPGKRVRFFIGFPFDPTSAESMTGYDKTRFMSSNVNMRKFLDREEILLASEFWYFLSGEKLTMEYIIGIINAIATPDFELKYRFLNNEDRRTNDEDSYKKQLLEWKLYSELRIVENDAVIRTEIAGDQRLTRTYNKLPFHNGNYSVDRFNKLNELIS